MSLSEADRKVVRAFVNERVADSRLLESDGRKLDKMGLGGETVAFWADGRIAIVSTESVKSDEAIIRAIIKDAGPGVVDFSYARKGHRTHALGSRGQSPADYSSAPEPRFKVGDPVRDTESPRRGVVTSVHHYDPVIRGYRYKVKQSDGRSVYWNEGPMQRDTQTPNGRGVYYDTVVGKNDMVLHRDHRGRWRIDLVTTASGNHTDVTGRESGAGPNQGYSTPEKAFEGALDEQRRRGLRGKTHVWIQRGDGFEDYEPEGDYLPNGMDEFTRSFFHTALWSSTDDSREDGGDPLDANYSIEDIDPHSLQKLSEECEQFQTDNAADLEGFDSGTAGHDFWLTRCGHGAGFWDGDYPEPQASRLTKASEDFGNVDLYVGDDGKIYAAGYEPPMQSNSRRAQANGRRTGILSDGTRVNVYHKPGTLDEYTVVPHSLDWDAQARGGMRSMLGLSKTGAGFSQWTEGQEGRHLGRAVAWDEVPEELKRHIERRVVSETMVANPRKRTSRKPKAETREARIARQWDEAEEAGLVKLDSDAEQENYFDVYGEPDDAEEREELIRQIERQGLWHVASFYLDQTTGNWAQADSIGMMFGDSAADPNDPYILDLKQAALENIYGGHEPNPRGTTVDEHAKRELELYIENEYALIGDPNSMGKSIDANLRKKFAKGKYDPARAPQAWQYLIDEGAKRYAKAYSSSERDATQMFNAATRRAVAAEFARAWEAENIK